MRKASFTFFAEDPFSEKAIKKTREKKKESSRRTGHLLRTSYSRDLTKEAEQFGHRQQENYSDTSCSSPHWPIIQFHFFHP